MLRQRQDDGHDALTSLRSWGPLAALAALSVVWGTQFLVIKAGQATVPPLLTVALRFAIVACASQVIVTATRLRAPPGTLAARALFGAAQAFSMATFYWSDGRLPSALVAVLVATEPFFVALLAHRFVPDERLDLRTSAALLLGFCGAVLIASSRAPGSTSSGVEAIAAAAVIAGCVAGASNKIIGKRLSQAMPAPVMMRDMGLAVAALAGAASLALERGQPVRFTTGAVVAFIHLGLVASTAASTVYFVLLRRFPVNALAYLQFVTTIVAVAAGVLVGRERLAGTATAGVALVLFGLMARVRIPRATAVASDRAGDE